MHTELGGLVCRCDDVDDASMLPNIRIYRDPCYQQACVGFQVCHCQCMHTIALCFARGILEVRAARDKLYERKNITVCDIVSMATLLILFYPHSIFSGCN